MCDFYLTLQYGKPWTERTVYQLQKIFVSPIDWESAVSSFLGQI